MIRLRFTTAKVPDSQCRSHPSWRASTIQMGTISSSTEEGSERVICTYGSTLKYKVNFVVREQDVWESLRHGDPASLSEAEIAANNTSGIDCWAVLTYVRLRQRGDAVTLSSTPVADAINVVPPRIFGRRDRGIEPFFLVPRADTHRPQMANFYLEQNTGMPISAYSDVIPLWPQPAILPRDKHRGTEVSRISFKGQIYNLDPNFRSKEFIESLNEIGVSLETDAFIKNKLYVEWHDYRKVDVVLAVRNLTVHDAQHKPASKLVNAWFGEVPAVLGPEPAFQAIRRSELDYIEVASPAEALDAVRRLRSDPGLYRTMVENGRCRRAEFEHARLADRWVELINTRVGPRFEAWHRTPFAWKVTIWAWMMASEPISKRLFLRRIRHGPRILDRARAGG